MTGLKTEFSMIPCHEDLEERHDDHHVVAVRIHTRFQVDHRDPLGLSLKSVYKRLP